MKEQAVVFGGSRTLVGVLTEPPEAADSTSSAPAVLLLNAGLLHRVGPNRLYVKLARAIARRGHAVLRFDFSGIGDTAVRTDDLPMAESVVAETVESMDYLQGARGIDRFVPCGLCLGADVAYQVARRDRRVVGAILLNGADFYRRESDASSSGGETGRAPAADVSSARMHAAQARTRLRYHVSRLWSLRSWRRLLTGESEGRAVRESFASLFGGLRRDRPSTEDRPAADFAALSARGVELLLAFSQGSTAWDYYRLYFEHEAKAARAAGRIEIEVVPDTDHVFTLLESQETLTELVLGWLERHSAELRRAREPGAAR